MRKVYFENEELIRIARVETDSELKLQAVRQLSMLQSDEAREFMLEIPEQD